MSADRISDEDLDRLAIIAERGRQYVGVSMHPSVLAQIVTELRQRRQTTPMSQACDLRDQVRG